MTSRIEGPGNPESQKPSGAEAYDRDANQDAVMEALIHENEAQKAEIESLSAELAALKAENSKRDERLDALEEDTRDLDRYMQRFASHHMDDEQPAEGRVLEDEKEPIQKAAPAPGKAVTHVQPAPAAEVAPEESEVEPVVEEAAEAEETPVAPVPTEAPFSQTPPAAESARVPSRELERVATPEQASQEESAAENENDEAEQEEPGKEVAVRAGQELVAQQEKLTELQERLEAASDRYAELSGKSRNGYIGRLLVPNDSEPEGGRIIKGLHKMGKPFRSTGRFLAKITGIKKIAEKINERTDAEIHKAREEYQEAIDECRAALAETIKAQNPDAGAEIGRKIQFGTAAMLSQINLAFEHKVAAERMNSAKKTNAFVNFWVRQKGLGGKAIKALTVAAPGVGLGIAAGAFLVPVAGIAMGAAAGLYIGHHVSKRRANAVDKDGSTLASRQAAEDHQRTNSMLEEFTKRDIYKPVEEAENHENTDTAEAEGTGTDVATQAEMPVRFVMDNDAIPSGADLTKVAEERNAREIQGNRARVRTAAAIAGAAGGAAAVGPAGLAARARNLADGVADIFNGDAPAKGFSSMARPEAGIGTAPEAPVVDLPPTTESVSTPEIIGNDFTVESGHGFTHELQDFARANGHELSGDQANELYKALQQRFGDENLIDLKDHAQDVYPMGDGSYGINAPGAANWRTDVDSFAINWMTSQGL